MSPCPLKGTYALENGKKTKIWHVNGSVIGMEKTVLASKSILINLVCNNILFSDFSAVI